MNIEGFHFRELHFSQKTHVLVYGKRPVFDGTRASFPWYPLSLSLQSMVAWTVASTRLFSSGSKKSTSSSSMNSCSDSLCGSDKQHRLNATLVSGNWDPLRSRPVFMVARRQCSHVGRNGQSRKVSPHRSEHHWIPKQPSKQPQTTSEVRHDWIPRDLYPGCIYADQLTPDINHPNVWTQYTSPRQVDGRVCGSSMNAIHHPLTCSFQ